jgi:predicted extracellular nuclease
MSTWSTQKSNERNEKMKIKNMHLRKLISTLVVLALVIGLVPFTGIKTATATVAVFINEIHYDNSDADAGEAIEVAGPAGTDLTGWSLVLYNGNGNVVYDTDYFSQIIPNQQSGYGTVMLSYPVNGIQNGSPDGIALVDSSNNVVQFLSYEGTILAADGPAVGMTSVDIGVIEDSTTPVGYSLQLSGTGSGYDDFTWSAPTANTFGAVNNEQTFVGPATEPKINEFSASTTDTDVEYVEIYGDPDTDYSDYTVLEIEGDSDAAVGTIDEVISIGTTDANGIWNIDLVANSLENGTITLLLVKDFSGELGDDIDADNDGVIDFAPWETIVDAVAVNDGGSTDVSYGEPVLGVSYDGLPYAPGGASRYPDGFDTDATTDWVRNDFDLAGIEGYVGTITLGEAYNTPGEFNQIYEPAPEACGDPFTPIYEVQGNDLTSPVVGTEVAVEGIVVGDFQNNGSLDNGDLNGFNLQDAVGDDDPATSDGIFIYYPSGTTDVEVGDVVRVRGSVSEYSGLTEITVGQIWDCESTGSIDPTPISLPVTDINDFEPYEGMLVTFTQELVISEYYNYDRYGEMVLGLPLEGQSRLYTPTSVVEPGQPAIDLAAENSIRRITLDDGLSAQNPAVLRHPNGHPFSLTNLFRGGDLVMNATGVLDYTRSLYRIQPTEPAVYTAINPRPEARPEVGGNLQIAAMNTLNFFLTPDYPTGDPLDYTCGPLLDMECRGWDFDQPTEFTRQRTKLLQALYGLDAGVIGLNEIENTTGVEPLADLVTGLNDLYGYEAYTYIDTGVIGTDAIRVGMIYRIADVTPVGDYALLTSAVDPRFIDTLNRPSMAQTFEENSSGELFTVVVNHLKSKGSACDGDPDLGDGQGNCNLTRTLAAQALVDWLATDPTGSGDADFIIMGDLNSYAMEDPIDAIKAGADDTLGTADDYTNLIYDYQGLYAYSYVFDGQVGYLDHALANLPLASQVTGTAVWHINADEADVLDYDTSYKSDEQDLLYEPNEFRTSDHDAVIVGLDLASEPVMTYLYLPLSFRNAVVGGSASASEDLSPAYVLNLDADLIFERKASWFLME